MSQTRSFANYTTSPGVMECNRILGTSTAHRHRRRYRSACDTRTSAQLWSSADRRDSEVTLDNGQAKEAAILDDVE